MLGNSDFMKLGTDHGDPPVQPQFLWYERVRLCNVHGREYTDFKICSFLIASLTTSPDGTSDGAPQAVESSKPANDIG